MEEVSRVLGLDVGTRTIGVAVSDPLGLTAQGVTVIRRQSREQDLAALEELGRLYNARGFVVGYPRNMDGSVGPQARYTEAFGKVLESRGWSVEYFDERLSTRIARRALQEGGASRATRKRVIDQQAAIIILQDYLDRQKRTH